MARKEKIYRRLPGRPFLPFVSWSLWQGPDHLLWVSSAFFRERYQRFYYKDIQSLVQRRTNDHLVWTFVWAALALLSGIAMLATSGPHYASGGFLSLFTLALLTNILLGPSCTVFLQTAVQVQKISCLRRKRTANKTMDLVKTLVEERQGPWQIPQGTAARSAARSAAHGQSVPSPGPIAATGVTPEPQGPFLPLLHRILFGIFIAMGILGLGQILIKSLPLALVEAMLHAAVQVLVIVALVRWYRHIKDTALAKINWLALVFVAIMTLIGYGLYMAASFRNPDINYHNWAMFKMMFDLQMTDHPVALVGNIIYAGGCLLIGTFGLLLVLRSRKG